jgi:hypothetical protein
MGRDSPGQVLCKPILIFFALLFSKNHFIRVVVLLERFCIFHVSPLTLVPCRLAGSGTKERELTDDLPISNPYPLAFHNLRV